MSATVYAVYVGGSVVAMEGFDGPIEDYETAKKLARWTSAKRPGESVEVVSDAQLDGAGPAAGFREVAVRFLNGQEVGGG